MPARPASTRGPAIGRAVVPVLFNSDRDSYDARRLSTFLDAQWLLRAARSSRIGVPKDQPRLRFFISAAHREDEIRSVADLLANRPYVEESRKVSVG